MGCDTERSLVDPPSPSVRRLWPRKRMCPTGTDALWPRPAPSPKERRLLKFLESSALLTRAGAATWPEHRTGQCYQLTRTAPRGLCLPVRTAAGTRRVSIATAFSPGGPGLPRGACCAWRSGSGATVKPRPSGTAWLLQSSRTRGSRPGCGGRRRPRGGPGPGACGASAELAGRAGARAAAPPPGTGKGGCAELLRTRIRLTRL